MSSATPNGKRLVEAWQRDVLDGVMKKTGVQLDRPVPTLISMAESAEILRCTVDHLDAVGIEGVGMEVYQLLELAASRADRVTRSGTWNDFVFLGLQTALFQVGEKLK